MNKVQRNRTLVIVALVLLVGSLVIVNNYYPISGLLEFGQPAEEQTPEQVIEQTGTVDVIYYEAPEVGASGFLGVTPIVGIGMIYYPPDPYEMPYYVELTPKGYKIIEGIYDWSPDVPEDPPGSYHNKYNVWSWDKFFYYKEGAMFVSGQYERVSTALYEAGEWYSQKALADMFYGIFKAATMTEGEWRAIEIDLLAVGYPHQALAIGEGGTPETAVIFPTNLQTTIVIFRARKEEVFVPEGKWATITHTLDQIVEQGELSYDELQLMLEEGQAQFIPAMSFFGLRPYTRGINCEWQGREIEMLKQAMQQ